jgi:predicted regulator of Ras-like GTPase activity (Roadblock/LC7/MglB family)
MDAAQALADLTEISTQIEAAVVVDARGKVAASTLDDERSQRVAAAARQLLDAADQLGSDNGAIAQIDAATPEGSVFVVRHGEYLIAATTGPEPTVGLVFYDLKSCLRSLAEQESAAPPKPKRAPRKAAPRKPAATKKKSDAES